MSSIGGVCRAGALSALFAVAAPAAGQVWEVDDRLLELSIPTPGANYGAAVAIGDYDGDGRRDLAVGAPFWVGELDVPGGRMEFFRNLGDRELFREWAGSSSSSEQRGTAIVFGDFDADGRDEIAVGGPGLEVSGQASAGIVRIYDPQQIATFDQDDFDGEAPGIGDHFGSTLAVGDFDGDGYEDLAIGVPDESSAEPSAGCVHVLFGGDGGLAAAGAQLLRPNNHNSSEHYGAALAAGDFDGDDYDDLAIGIPGRTAGGAMHSGAVQVFYGSSDGLGSDGESQAIVRESFNLPFAAADEYRLGSALAAGNFDQQVLFCGLFVDCYDDLAIGEPGASTDAPMQGAQADAGLVLVVPGSSAGLLPASRTILSQLDGGGVPAAGERFGTTLAAGRLDRPTTAGTTGYSDLAVGVPFDSDLDGSVHLFFGAAGGINSGSPAQLVELQAGLEIAPAGASDEWGRALAIGDLDGDGWGDLVVGVPAKSRGGEAGSGAVEILWGGLFADGFDGFGLTGWSVP